MYNDIIRQLDTDPPQMANPDGITRSQKRLHQRSHTTNETSHKTHLDRNQVIVFCSPSRRLVCAIHPNLSLARVGSPVKMGISVSR